MAGEEAPLEQLLLKGSKFNTAIVADTDIFTSALSPTSTPTYFRIYATFDTAGVLIVKRTQSAVTISEELNSGATLTANSAYVFDIIVQSGQTINLQYNIGATALELSVTEIGEGI